MEHSKFGADSRPSGSISNGLFHQRHVPLRRAVQDGAGDDAHAVCVAGGPGEAALDPFRTFWIALLVEQCIACRLI